MGLCVGYYFLFKVFGFFALDVFLFPQSQRTANLNLVLSLVRELSDLAVCVTLIVLLS